MQIAVTLSAVKMSWESLDVSISAGDDSITRVHTKNNQDNPVFQLDNIAVVKSNNSVSVIIT